MRYREAADQTWAQNRREALRWFVPHAKSSEELFRHVEFREIDWMPASTWRPINPSVCVFGGRRIATIRTVNYTQKNWDISTIDGSPNLRSRNFVLEFDENWRVTSETEIEDCSDVLLNDDGFRAHGFEDCRLVQKDTGWFAVASVRNLSSDLAYQCSAYGSTEVALLRFDDLWRIVAVDVIRDYERHLIQKNWTPVAGRYGEFLYLFDPTIVVRRTPTGTEEVSRYDAPVCLTDLRGGSQCIEYEDGWICLPHEVAQWGSGRVYLHRFVRLDRDFRIVEVSDPFYFRRLNGVEFCAGLTWDGGHLVASYGANDGGTSWLALFTPEGVSRALVRVA